MNSIEDWAIAFARREREYKKRERLQWIIWLACVLIALVLAVAFAVVILSGAGQQ